MLQVVHDGLHPLELPAFEQVILEQLELEQPDEQDEHIDVQDVREQPPPKIQLRMRVKKFPSLLLLTNREPKSCTSIDFNAV
ncbi:MAG: hypothetical protein IJU92_10055 [Spirochaetaceae bacterium]|nr:hypothetical protein [Spirochaetaceae bacterium]